MFVTALALGIYAVQTINICTHLYNCVQTTKLVTLFLYVPQAMFFIVFIWVIFRLLVIWRSMFKESEKEQKDEKSRLFRLQIAYLVIWFLVWVIQRVLEAVIINELSKDELLTAA